MLQDTLEDDIATVLGDLERWLCSSTFLTILESTGVFELVVNVSLGNYEATLFFSFDFDGSYFDRIGISNINWRLLSLL